MAAAVTSMGGMIAGGGAGTSAPGVVGSEGRDWVAIGKVADAGGAMGEGLAAMAVLVAGEAGSRAGTAVGNGRGSGGSSVARRLAPGGANSSAGTTGGMGGTGNTGSGNAGRSAAAPGTLASGTGGGVRSSAGKGGKGGVGGTTSGAGDLM